MASVSCCSSFFFLLDAVSLQPTGCCKDADAFQIDRVPALYSPGLTMATDTELEGTGKDRHIHNHRLNGGSSTMIVTSLSSSSSASSFLRRRGGGGRAGALLFKVKNSDVTSQVADDWLCGGIFLNSTYTQGGLIYDRLSSLPRTTQQFISLSVFNR